MAGLLAGFGFGLVLMSPTASALSMVPGLSLLAPSNNSNVSGTITFVAAADSEGLVSLQFKVDGADFGSPITAGSCRATFDTRGTSDGPHTIQAIGQDEFGNPAFSSPSTIFVNNVAPAISSVFVTNVTSSSATINWSTAAAADGRVDFGTSMSYGLSAYVASMTTSHSVTLSSLSGGTTYHFAAMSVGANGILSTSGDFVFTTAGAPTNPTPTPTPNPTPTPSPTPVVPGPTPTPHPTPSPTPIVPGPTPTPTPTPIVPGPTPTPSPSPTETTSGTHGRQAPAGSTSTGSATVRVDGTNYDLYPTPQPTPIGTATVRGGGTTTAPPPGSGNTIVRGSGGTSSTVGVSGSYVGGVTGGSGQGLTASMFMPGWTQQNAAQIASSTTNTAQKRGAQSRTEPTSDKPSYTPCAGPDPFINDGGGSCINGTWTRKEQPVAATATPATTSSEVPATGSTSATTPPEVTSAAPTTQTKAPTKGAQGSTSGATTSALKPQTATACSTPDPFKAKGGVGLCINGEWVALFKPSKGK